MKHSLSSRPALGGRSLLAALAAICAPLLVAGCLMETGPGSDPTPSPSTLSSDLALTHTSAVEANGPGPHPLDPPPVHPDSNVGTKSSNGTVLTIQPVPMEEEIRTDELR